MNSTELLLVIVLIYLFISKVGSIETFKQLSKLSTKSVNRIAKIPQLQKSQFAYVGKNNFKYLLENF